MNGAYEAQKRLEKAMKLADTLAWTVRLHVGPDESAADIAKKLDDDAWKLAEKKAGTRPSSDETRTLVVKILEDREQDSDPFDGVPTVDNPTGKKAAS